MTAGNNASKNIINYKEKLLDKKNDEQFSDYILNEVKERAEKKAIEHSDEITRKRINSLEIEVQELEAKNKELETNNKKLEVESMRKQVKLQMCIPSEMLVCLCATIVVVTACITTLIIQIVANVKIIDYYLVIFVLVGGLGLLHTSITTFKNWRGYITDEGES